MKLLFSLLLAIFIFLAMSLPSLSVAFKDTSSGGEMFPMQRIIQMNDLRFKRIMASDIETSSLSDKFVREKANFAVYGNIVNLFYPDLAAVKNLFLSRILYSSELNLYIGIVSLLFSIIGLLYYRSPFRYVSLFMLIIIFVNIFSFITYGNEDSYNWLQEIFNTAFPFLKMIRIRYLVGIYLVLYLCNLTGMGLALMLNRETWDFLVRNKYRQIIAICIFVILLKISITWFAWEKILFAYSHDIFVILQLIVFGALIYLLHKNRNFLFRLFPVLMVALILTDLYLYNLNNLTERVHDKSSTFDFVDIKHTPEDKTTFQYFRAPFSFPPITSFQENIEKIKGAISRGQNHSIFTTKRYYDFVTHVPLEHQSALNGMLYPIIQFFPTNRVVPVSDKKELLNLYATNGADLAPYWLFVEDPTNQSIPLRQLDNFSQYEDVEWLNQPYLFYSQAAAYYAYYAGSRNDVRQFLESPFWSIQVTRYSLNEIGIHIKNNLDGYLYYNDGWSRYWRAFDGDRELPVLIANYNFKAVFLTRGDHHIRFIFVPVHYKVALLAYYSGLFSVVIAIGFFFLRNRQKDASSQY
jgi:hypothetical protein